MTRPHHASRDTGLRAYSLPHLTLATMMGVGVALVAPAVLAATAERAFDVPPGEAAGTLKQFAVQSGEQVVFMGDTVRGEKTQAVKGVYTPQQALTLMLAGTRLLVVRDPATGALAVKKAPPAPNAPRAVPTARKARAARLVQEPTGRAIELSPFTVTSEGNVGYQAANTLAGSRLNTPLRDTAASISVLTEEFINDVGALDLTEAIAFGNNVELDRTGGNQAFEFYDLFTIRGQAATVARNYFRWKLPTNTYNVERIEEARGPNAILFGFASAGGIISAATKQALTNRSFRRAQLVYGSYDLRRATVDLNQASTDGKLGVRFNAVAAKRQAYQHYVFNEDTRGHLAVKFHLTPTTVLRAEYEQGRTFANRADYQEVGDDVLKWIQAGRPLVDTPVADAGRGLALNNAAGSQAVVFIENDGIYADWRGQGITQGLGDGIIMDPALVDPVNYRINLGGPTQTQAAAFNTFSASVEHRFGRNTFLQLAFNRQGYDFEAWQATNPTGLKGDPNRFLADGITPNPHAGGLYFETYWINYQRAEASDNFRLTVSHEFDLGPWGAYRLAGLAEREESRWAKNTLNEAWLDGATGQGAYNPIPGNAPNRAVRRHYIAEGDERTWFASAAHPGLAGLAHGVSDPGLPGRTLLTGMVHSGVSDFDDRQEQDSGLLAGQAHYFNRRLVLAGGYRADTLRLHQSVRGLRDPVTQDIMIDNTQNPPVSNTVTAHTRTYGAVWHARSWLSLRYNRADSLELANTGVRLMPRPDDNGHFIGSRVGDNPQGAGEDYGVDLSLLGGKLFLRAARFSTTRRGAQGFAYGSTSDNPASLSNRVMEALLAAGRVTPAERELHRLNTGGAEFDVASRGCEFSVTANPTKNWRLQANWSVTDAVTAHLAPEIQVWAAAEIPYFQAFDQSIPVAALGALPASTIGQDIARWQAANAANLSADGVGTLGHRRQKASVATRWTFTAGALKGGYVGGACRHQGRPLLGFNRERREAIYGNSLTRVDAFVGYRFGPCPRLPFLRGLGLQLNVYNVLNRHDPLIGGAADANAAVPAVSRLAPQEPRTWRLTADLSF